MKFARHNWTLHMRDAKGEEISISCADPHSLLNDALRMNAVAITLHRGKRTRRKVSLDEVRGLFNK